MRSALALALTVALVGGPGCGGGSGDDDDGGVNIDADPSAPDADPDAPDADPSAPDADPAAPDADPSAPDAATDCGSGLELCGGECVDIDSDDRYCGNCFTNCGDQTCVEGICVTGVGTLVLAELHARAPSYFELYNGGASAIALEDYLIQWNTDNSGSGSIVLPVYSLAAGEFVVLHEGSGDDEGVIYLGDDIGWEDGIALRLLSPGGVGLDFVRTGNSVTDPPVGTSWTGDNARNPGATVDQSLVRNVYAADTDSAADWELVDRGSPGSYCPSPGRCGDTCFDFASDHDNCGDCGQLCGSTQLCIDSECKSGVAGPWLSEYRRYARAGVEIHNPTIDPVLMTGYRLDLSGANNLSYNFPAGFTLAPGAFVTVYMGEGTDDDVALFAGPSKAFAGVVAIALYDDEITALDFVRFGTSSAPAPPTAPWFGDNVAAVTSLYNGSARRNLEKLDTNSDADWVHASPATLGYACEPGLSQCDGYCQDLRVNPDHCGSCDNACDLWETCLAGTCSTSGAVLISEIRNQNPEAIEIFNGTDSAVDLEGWKLDWGGNTVGSYTIQSGVSIPAGGFIYFYESTGTSTATLIYIGSTIDWTDAIAVSLTNTSPTEVDFVRTGDSLTTGTWTGDNAVNPSSSQSLTRDVFVPDTNTAADWMLTAPTPALRCADDETVCGGACFDVDASADNCGSCGNSCGVAGLCDSGTCVRDGDVRLRECTGSDDGTSLGCLDAYHNDRWNVIYAWTNAQLGATVACRQMGYASANSYSSTRYSGCSGCGYLNSVSCTGDEVTLTDCSIPSSGTSPQQGVRVGCTHP